MVKCHIYLSWPFTPFDYTTRCHLVTSAIQPYVCLLPSMVKYCFAVGYADDHTLLTTIPHKNNRTCEVAAAHLNTDLAAYNVPYNANCSRWKIFAVFTD